MTSRITRSLIDGRETNASHEEAEDDVRNGVGRHAVGNHIILNPVRVKRKARGTWSREKEN